MIYPYNSGLAEESVSKIKMIKRIMHGRNSFALLKAKELFHVFFDKYSTGLHRFLLNTHVVIIERECPSTILSQTSIPSYLSGLYHVLKLYNISMHYYQIM